MIEIRSYHDSDVQVVQLIEEHGYITLGPAVEARLLHPGESMYIEDWHIGISYLIRLAPV